MASPTLPVPFLARWRLAGDGADRTGRLTLDDLRCFAGHYPDRPILPGLLLVEAVAQAASAAVDDDPPRDLREIAACRLRSPLLPGDEIAVDLHVTDGEGGATRVGARIRRGTDEVASLALVLGLLEAPPPIGAALLPGVSWDEALPSARLLDGAAVIDILPHRPPALLVDEALVIAGGEGGRPALLARRRLPLDETGAGGRFPPTLLAESFCQSCGLLYFGASSVSPSIRRGGRVPVLARLAGFRFPGQALPGDLVEHRARIVAAMADGAVFSGETLAGGRCIAAYERCVVGTAAPR